MGVSVSVHPKNGHLRMLTEIANLSPILPVTNPRVTRPIVIPNQKPVAVIPLAKALPCLTLRANVTTQPPTATSMPT